MDRWLVNGTESDRLPVDDRGLAYGDGLFETIAVRNGDCRFLQRHLDRLAAGCQRLGMAPPDRTTIESELQTAIGSAATGTLKLIVTRGSGRRGYAPPADAAPTRIVGFSAGAPLPAAPARVISCARRIARQPLLAGLKTLNRLEQVMAAEELAGHDSKPDEGLMYDDLDRLVCGTMSNVFVRVGGRWMTPALDESGVAGVMRAVVIDVLNELDMSIEVAAISRAEVAAADAMFLSNALRGVRPVSELDGRSLGVTDDLRRLTAALADKGVAECYP